MLIFCPDCKRQISYDVDVCPRCGCNIAKKKEEEYIFEEPVIHHYNKLGLASAIMVPAFAFYWMVVNAIGHDRDGLFCTMILAYCGAQIGMGIYSIYKDPKAYKWPSVVGIVGSAIMLLFILLAII
ncbi:MAG: hypothetical protein K5868_05930 [Lachnospiraceae bacterium]|nr:hypothetical protein [Lachnospiraceae bacterium]